MSDLKPRGVPIVLEGVGERNLLFDFNAIDELQEKYSKNLLEILNDMTQSGTKDVSLFRSVVTILLNAEQERLLLLHGEEIPVVTERAVGGMLGLDNYTEVLRAVLKAYGISMPEPEEDENPNAKSGQQNK